MSLCEWELFVPLMEVKPRYNRRLKKMINQSPWLTLNDRDAWFRRKRLTEYYRVMGRTAAELADLPKGLDHIHVEYWVSYGSNRRLDPHNYMLTAKAVVDGLVDYGLIADDDSKRLTGPDPRRDESLPVGLTVRVFRVGGRFDESRVA